MCLARINRIVQIQHLAAIRAREVVLELSLAGGAGVCQGDKMESVF